MPREIFVMGLSMPTLVPLFFLCLVFLWLLEKYVFVPRRVYRKVAHPPLFRIAVFVLLFCCAGLVVY